MLHPGISPCLTKGRWALGNRLWPPSPSASPHGMCLQEFPLAYTGTHPCLPRCPAGLPHRQGPGWCHRGGWRALAVPGAEIPQGDTSPAPTASLGDPLVSRQGRYSEPLGPAGGRVKGWLRSHSCSPSPVLSSFACRAGRQDRVSTGCSLRLSKQGPPPHSHPGMIAPSQQDSLTSPFFYHFIHHALPLGPKGPYCELREPWISIFRERLGERRQGGREGEGSSFFFFGGSMSQAHLPADPRGLA